MINIKLDLGDAPSVLAAFANQSSVQKVVNAAAESYVDDIHDFIDAGHAFTPRTGQLQQATNWRPTGNGTAEIYANTDYAGYVEQGTKAHKIAPKPGGKGLKIGVAGGGGYIIRRAVNHPGSKPHPFFFSDQPDRLEHMQAKALSVLAQAMDR